MHRSRALILAIGCLSLSTASLAMGQTSPPLRVAVQDVFGVLQTDAVVSYEIQGGDAAKAAVLADGSCLLDVEAGSKVRVTVEHPIFGVSMTEVLAPPGPSFVRITVGEGGAEAKLTAVHGLTLPQFALGAGGSDSCSTATAISGEGTFGFDNSLATPDGLDDLLCDFFGTQAIDNDVWFLWTAPCDGDVTLDTCGSSVDTKIAVYDSTACPPGSLLACNDDLCGLQSRLTFPAVSGSSYLLRIGTFPGATGGVGDITLTCQSSGTVDCDTGVGCQLPDQAAHGSSGTLAATSDRNPAAGFTAAENFQTTASPASGLNHVVSNLCWWGIYFDFALFADCAPGSGDDFQVIYYNDDAGGAIPGSVHAGPLSLSPSATPTGNILIAGGSAVAEYQFEASHIGVNLLPDTCYWIEISNNTTGNCFWLWSTAPAGDNRSGQDVGTGYSGTDFDLGFCLDVDIHPDGCGVPTGPSNDDCEMAVAISGEGLFPFDNSVASSVGPDHAACDFFGNQSIDNDVWFCWTASCDSMVQLETCGLTGVDTKIAVYDGCACPPQDADLLACNDDDCGLQSSLIFPAVAGNEYLIRIGTFSGASGGSGSFQLDCELGPPDNDVCESAMAVGIPSVTSATTENASVDDNAPFCGTSVTSPGVWFQVIGDGTTYTADVCNGATAFDSKISIYCGDCPDGLVCVDGNDDFCGLQSQISWCTQNGAHYLILVHGFGGAEGPFELSVSTDGVHCGNPDVLCIPIGACCLGDGVCEVVAEADCVLAIGDYLGDDTDCGDAMGYTVEDCDNPFHDISGTGLPLVLGDDDGVTVPLGFSFNFFGTDFTDISVCSNGYLTFGSDLTDFSNDPIPTSDDPNDLIAPLWDDYDPTLGGSIEYDTIGTAPNQQFIAQWSGISQFGNTDSNTFQAVFSEGSNSIEFRYGEFTAEVFAGDITIGVENSDGSDGTGVDPTTVAPGDCLEFAPLTGMNPCPILLQLDLRTGQCPNRLSLNSDGFVKSAILGTAEFDVSMIDITTLSIARVHGPAGSVAPHEGPPGPRTVIEDVATPFPPRFDCDCEPTGKDGYDDLFMKFSSHALLIDLQLMNEQVGTSHELRVTGQLLDGTPFEAFDCLEIEPIIPGNPLLAVRSNPPGVYVEVSPVDDAGEDAGMTPFRRHYPRFSRVELEAPRTTVDGKVFAGWVVNGTMRPSPIPRLQVNLGSRKNVEAIYVDAPSGRLR